MLTDVTAVRYVTPLREGGSLPGLMEADDLGTYVVKFHGAGQGRKALIAEVIGGELARALGLPVPALVTIEVDPGLAANEPDEEVQSLLRASGGRNLGVDFLPGALDLDTTAFTVSTRFAGRVLWFDALIGNVDRSWRNPNMLFWHGAPYLIDHGAALTFHHNWAATIAPRAYDARDHALLGCSPDLDDADATLTPMVTDQLVTQVVALVPEVWLIDEPGFTDASAVRAVYVDRLLARARAHDEWLPGLRQAVADNPTRERSAPTGGTHLPSWLDGRK
jgi:hypothetical protein